MSPPPGGGAPKHAIVQAVEMHRHERRPRMEAMRKSVAEANVGDWARSFLEVLDEP